MSHDAHGYYRKQRPSKLPLHWDVRGHFHWTLADNFEWGLWRTPPFGLYALHRETLTCTSRPLAQCYAGIRKSRSILSDMVRRYAPDLLETMIPK